VNTPGASSKNKEETRRPKYVSISMPSGMQKPVVPAPTDQREVKPLPKATIENIQKPAPVSVVHQETHVPEERKAVIVVPEQTSTSNSIKGGVLQFFAIAAAVISLVAVGILIGMGLGTNKIQNVKPAPRETATETAATIVSNAQEENVVAPVTPPQPDSASQSLATAQQSKPKKSNAKPAVDNPVIPALPTVISEPVLQAPAETTKVTDAKDLARQNLAKLISVSTNDYKVGMFGGIDDVKVTVYNASEYPIDLVVVDVSYIQSNKKSYKTESLHFNDIAANSSLTLDAPKASKGIRVKTILTHISSKSLGISENIW
jgi:hypothetical protein